VAIATGSSLQGRPLVAQDALRPALVSDDSTRPDPVADLDPTFAFAQLSSGHFTVFKTIELSSQIRGMWRKLSIPVRYVDLAAPSGIALGVVTVLGLGLALALSGPVPRRGIASLALQAVAIALVMAWFALAFDTYVPRQTGLHRFAQYSPFISAGLATFALYGLRLAVARRSEAAASRFALVVAVAATALALLPAIRPPVSAQRVSEVGLEALQTLRDRSGPGDVVVHNVITGGSVGILSGLEAPLEGRQPLIEDTDFLMEVNQTLSDAHDFFVAPADARFPARFGARWLLVSDDPSTLGGFYSFGGRVTSMRAQPYVRERWSAPGIALFETVPALWEHSARAGEPPARALEQGGAFLLAALALAAALFALTRLARAKPAAGEK
jgi:hypothetical protein